MSDIEVINDSSDDSDTGVDNNLARLLTCPICDYYMAPPIKQCSIGHNFCYECYKLIHQCPKCASPKVNTRNYELEQLYTRVKLNCKNLVNGCQFKARSKTMPIHEAACAFTMKVCPFNFTCLCSWTGVIFNLQEHCADVHYRNYSTCTVNRQTFTHFENCHHGFSMYVYFTYNCAFRVTFYIDLKSGWLKFATYYLGQPNKKGKFSYEIKFLKENTDRSAITLKAECEYLRDHTMPFANKNFFTMPVNVLKAFCDNSGDLHYVLTIIDNRHLPQASGSK